MKKFTLILLLMLVFLAGSIQAQKNTILFITDGLIADSDGNFDLDAPLIEELSAKYDVTVTYAPFDYADMNNYGMVFVGRSVNSGEFTDMMSWSQVEVPVLFVSVWLMRENRLKFFSTNDARKVANDGIIYTGVVTTVKVLDESDPAFKDVELSNGEIEWYNSFYDYFFISHENFDLSNNGTPLAYITGDDITPDANGNVVMARWEPGVETYEGSGNIPAAYRTFLQNGADDNYNPRNYNYNNYTNSSLQVIFNEVEFLLKQSKNYVATGVERIEMKNKMAVYNINGNEMVINLSDNGKPSHLEISVFNLAGQVVYHQKTFSESNVVLVIPDLNPGVYITMVKRDDKIFTGKVSIKQ